MSRSSRQYYNWKLFLTRLGPVIVLVLISSMLAAPAQADKGNSKAHHDVELGPVKPPKPATSSAKPTKAVTGTAVDSAVVGTHAVDPIGMKVLVIAADGTEAGFPAIKAFLDQIGVPYDILMAATTELTQPMLWDGGVNGYYQGIILTTDSLVYNAGGGNYPSAFTPDEWNILWTYESTFKIRQVTFNTTGFGPEPLGLEWPNWDDTTRRLNWQQTATTPIKATLAAGQQYFSYLNASYEVPFGNADVVLAKPVTAMPLFTTPDGYALVSTYTNPSDGRENLAITADNNPDLRHSLLLSYGVINWVTKGLFLGERHVYMNYQPDDICIEDSIWDPETRSDTTGKSYRMSGDDVVAVKAWQNDVQTRPNASLFRLEWPFNGEGCQPGFYSDATLWNRMNQHQQSFKWISHTWDHANLNYGVVDEDCPTSPCTDRYYADVPFITNELQLNHNWGVKKFSQYQKNSLVQPDISGLCNPYFYEAAYNFGTRYVISDTSRKPTQYSHDWSNPSPNAGYYAVAKFNSAADPSKVCDYRTYPGAPTVELIRSQTPLPAPALLVIPRYPTNLFYNLRTPEEWVSEYNCFYSKNTVTNPTPCASGQFLYWDNDLTYEQILDKESDWLLSYMLKWSVNPVMFHQPNTGQYAPGKTLLGDLVDVTLAKYNSMYDLPILSPTQQNQGVRMTNRMKYNASGVTAQLIPCGTPDATPSVTIKVKKPAKIPITGVAYGTSIESYGSQSISYVDVKAGANGGVTIPLTCQ